MPTLREVIYRTADGLSDRALAEVLAYAIRLLAARGVATAGQLQILHTLENHSEDTPGMIDSQGTQMDTTIQMFKFENKQEIRVVEGENGDPLFVAKDICQALNHSDVSMAVRALDDDEKGTREVCTPGGRQQMMCVTESGVYALIIRSNKPEARRFRKWVTSVVLPSIRKHGIYAVPGRQGMSLAHQALAMAQALVDHEERLCRLENAEQARREAQPGHQLPARAGIDSTEYYSIAAYTHIRGVRISSEMANEYGRRAARWSKDNGYTIGQAPDPRWGRVNTYHIDALEWVFDVDG